MYAGVNPVPIQSQLAAIARTTRTQPARRRQDFAQQHQQYYVASRASCAASSRPRDHGFQRGWARGTTQTCRDKRGSQRCKSRDDAEDVIRRDNQSKSENKIVNDTLARVLRDEDRDLREEGVHSRDFQEERERQSVSKCIQRTCTAQPRIVHRKGCVHTAVVASRATPTAAASAATNSAAGSITATRSSHSLRTGRRNANPAPQIAPIGVVVAAASVECGAPR